MGKTFSRNPPAGGAPEGTVWFGGPVDRFKISLRIYGEDLDPDQISALLGCAPTKAERKGVPVFAARGRWLLELDSRNLDESEDVDDGIRRLLAQLPSSPEVWATLSSRYAVDISCGLFLQTTNRGFGIPADLSKLLSDRGIDIGFDVYFDPPK